MCYYLWIQTPKTLFFITYRLVWWLPIPDNFTWLEWRWVCQDIEEMQASHISTGCRREGNNLGHGSWIWGAKHKASRDTSYVWFVYYVGWWSWARRARVEEDFQWSWIQRLQNPARCWRSSIGHRGLPMTAWWTKASIIINWRCTVKVLTVLWTVLFTIHLSVTCYPLTQCCCCDGWV